MAESYYRAFIRDNLVVILATVVVSLKGILLMPLIIKTAGVATYGGFVLLSSVLGIAFGLSSLGAGFKAKRFLPSAAPSDRAALFFPQFLFHMLSVCGFSAALMLFDRLMRAYLFRGQFDYSAWIIPSYLVGYACYAQACDYFRFTSRVNLMTALMLICPYLDIGLVLFFAHRFGYLSVNILVLSTAFSSAVVAAPALFAIIWELQGDIQFYSLAGLRADLRLGFPLVLNFIVDFILAASDRYLIAFFLSVAAVGYYNPGYVLGSLVIFVPKAMGTALPQLLSKAIDNRREDEAYKMLDYAIKIFLLLAIPFTVGSLALGKPVLRLLANNDVAEHAYLVAPIVALGTLFFGLNVILFNALFARMETKAIFKMNLVASILNVIGNLMLFVFFKDILVAAITTLVSYFVAFIVAYGIVKREWRVDFQPGIVIKSIAASLAMGVAVSWASSVLPFGGIGSLAAEVALGLGIYALGLTALGTFSEKEVAFVRNLIFEQAGLS